MPLLQSPRPGLVRFIVTLRNVRQYIRGVVRGNAVFFVEPVAQIDKPAAFAAERRKGITGTGFKQLVAGGAASFHNMQQYNWNSTFRLTWAGRMEVSGCSMKRTVKRCRPPLISG